MKKIILISVLLLLIICFNVSAEESGRFQSGQLVIGGSGALYINIYDIEDIDFRFNPDIGFFPVDNLLLNFGLNSRFSDYDMRIELGTGITYYILEGSVVPYLGMDFYYSIIDDFNGWDNSLFLGINAGLDIFLSDFVSIYFELQSPEFYINDADFFSTLGTVFGFHFYVPSGNAIYTG